MGGYCVWKELGDVRSSLGVGRGSSYRGVCLGVWFLYWRCILLKYIEGYYIRYDIDRFILCFKGRYSGEMGEFMRRKDKVEENGVRV